MFSAEAAELIEREPELRGGQKRFKPVILSEVEGWLCTKNLFPSQSS
jgi:hypothetical protein